MYKVAQLHDDDFPYISQRLDSWWGGRNMAAMLPRLWFKDFSRTSFVIKNPAGNPIAFLVGYISPQDPAKGYVHFIGVDPDYRKAGLGRKLYENFSAKVEALGVTRIEAVTSPVNTTSLGFHESLGFMARQSDGAYVYPSQSEPLIDFDGTGEDRVLMVCQLPLSRKYEVKG
ncbi:MAG: GNAT family N-acetyltransferase [Aurantimicrobium sp.]|uniref:GNAT family N-acetyltransferase n=1 Tax=Aurantimicrobium sp. TaxID=1930784 RepID=UPI002FC7419D